MNKNIFFLILFFTSFLFAKESGKTNTDIFDAFIDQQIKVEAKFYDQNLSLDEKIKIKKSQGKEYRIFFLQYASNKKKNLARTNIYRDEMDRIQIRLNNNRYLGNTNAVMRDEILLKNYTIRKEIRGMLNDVMNQTGSHSGEYFSDKVNEIIEKSYAGQKPLDTSIYQTADQNQSSRIVESLNAALQEHIYLDNVANTFSSELVENTTKIHHAARISNSKFLKFVSSINESPTGRKLNSYLSSIDLDSAKLILVLSIMVFTIALNYMLNFLVGLFLRYRKLKEDDIEYIHKHILNIFTMITSLVVIHFTLVVFLGIDSKSINISKIFATLYVVLVALLLYRITDTVAYLRIEQMKKSKILRNEVINLTIKVIHGFIITIAIIAMLKIVGVNLTALLSGLGIAGAAVAFAAKDSIANIFGSVSILLGDVFEQGDWIETKDVNGTVVEIGLRATTIRTFDNALISIPNFNLSDTAVTNWSRRNIGRRIKMSVGVTYESDFDDIRKAIEDIREMLNSHPDIAQKATSGFRVAREARLVSAEDFKGVKNTILVYMDEFADSSINILIYCFSRTVNWMEWLRVKEDVMYKIEEILRKNNLEFAYPAIMLHKSGQKEAVEMGASSSGTLP